MPRSCGPRAALARRRRRADAARGCARPRLVLVLLVLLQIYLGALVAGPRRRPRLQHLAADRRRVDPVGRPAAGSMTPAWRNLFENTLTVQFDHRMVAYAICGIAACCTPSTRRARRGGAALNGALAWPALVTLQAGLGIVTLLHQVPLPLALLHQIIGIVVLTVADRSCRAAVAIMRSAACRARRRWSRDGMIELEPIAAASPS